MADRKKKRERDVVSRSKEVTVCLDIFIKQQIKRSKGKMTTRRNLSFIVFKFKIKYQRKDEKSAGTF